MKPGLPSVPRTINEFPVLAHRPATDSTNEVCAVVLVQRDDGTFIVWTWNRECPGASNGKYDLTLDEAAAEFVRRHSRCYSTFDVGFYTPGRDVVAAVRAACNGEDV